MSSTEDRKRFLANRQKEVDGAALYRAMSESEPNTQMAELYRKFGDAEEGHAAAWEKKLSDLGGPVPARQLSWRAQAMIWLARRFGTHFVLPTVTGMERADSVAYEGQPEAEAGRFSADEKSHARLLAAASSSSGGLAGGSIAQLEGRHRAGSGNALRAAVLGANDGIVSTASLVLGVAASHASRGEILVAGIAGLVALNGLTETLFLENCNVLR